MISIILAMIEKYFLQVDAKLTVVLESPLRITTSLNSTSRPSPAAKLAHGTLPSQCNILPLQSVV